MKTATLRRLGAAALLAAFAAPILAAPSANVEREWTLDTPTGRLSALELRPAGDGVLPLVILHAGSGPTDRDGNTLALGARNDSLKQLAEALAARGIATLRLDKRGIGGSLAARPTPANASVDLFAADAATWLRQARADKGTGKLVFAGHSEGSLIGMLALQESPADGFISIAGPAHRLSDVLRDQLKPKLPPDLWQENERILVALEHGDKVASIPAPLMPLYAPPVQPYIISSFRRTPMDELKKLNLPVLVLQGDADIQVATAEARLLAAVRPGIPLKLIGGMNHVLKRVGADPVLQQRSYVDAQVPLEEQAADAIAEFVRALP